MDINVRSGDVLAEASDLAVVAVSAGGELPPSVADLFEADDFVGDANQVLVTYPRGSVAPRRVLLVGLGDAGTIDAERIRQAAATAVRRARDLQAADVTFGVAGPVDVDGSMLGEALAEGLALGAYRYLHHQTKLTDKQRFEVRSVTVLTDGSMTEAVTAGVETGTIIARGVVLARDLVNRPPESKTPPLLADEAVAIGERVEGVTVTVFDEVRLAEEGFGGILAVGRASAAPPRFIVMEYGSDLADVPTICLVGKGLTFDSGGLNIKPADGMLTMKNDMGGSAAVFGAVQVAAELGLPLHIVGLVPSAENMIDGTAYRPGDIVTSMSGTTIEIINTDAEGRVILCDGLHYAQRYEPDAIINLATLTGAVIVSLGHYASGLWATDDDLAAKLASAGDASSDRVWRMPMDGEYADLSKSDIADLKNHPGRFAGSIGAAVFLAAFTGDYPFAHLDIAGTAWIDSPKKPYLAPGGTGAGVKVLTEFLRNYQA